MRILWLKSDYVAPPDTGGKLRTYNLLRELRKQCHITYASFRPEEPVDRLPRLEDCAAEVVTFYRPEEKKSGANFYLRVLGGMRSRLPYIVQKYRSRAFVDLQRKWFEDLPRSERNGRAVVVCDFLEMTENVDWSIPVPKVLFQHNVESMIWRRYRERERNFAKRAYFGFEHRRMAAYEKTVCNRFDLVFTVSGGDKELLTRQFQVRTPIEVLETGVDVEYFASGPTLEPVPGRIVFVGSLDWMPNIDGLEWFVTKVYPIIRARAPHVELHVVGRRPTAAMRRLPSGDASITVIADAPDVRPHVASADVFVVPLRIGGGSRIKIYEAMAMGRPVVSTSIGAEGLPLKPGEHIAIGDSAEELAERVRELLQDDEKKEAMAARGQQFVNANFPWSRIAERLHEECANVARRCAAPS